MSYKHDHLLTDAAETRQVLAAHYMNDCDIVVEVGGGRNPVYGYMESSPMTYVIDPDGEWEHYAELRHMKMPLQAFNFDNLIGTGRRKGLCMLGMELVHFDKDREAGLADPVEFLISKLTWFNRVVIEYVTSNTESEAQAFMLHGALEALGVNCILDFRTTWQFDRKYFVTKEAQGQEPNPSFYKERRFLVYDK